MVCNYAGTPHWLPDQVISILGPVSYQVSLTDGRSQRRHQDQLLKTTHTFDTRSEINTDFNFCTFFLMKDLTQPQLCTTGGG